MSLRRNFLVQGAAALAGASFLQMASSHTAESENPAVQKKSERFIDTHVHLWTNDLQKYPLSAGFTREEMKPAVFLPADIFRHAHPSGVDRVVLVQMSYYGFDNSYMLDAIRQHPRVFRGIAVIDWKANHPDETMRELSSKGVRGFRIYPGDEPPSTWLDQAGFDKMFRCGADEHLAMCPLINPDVLPSIDRQCKKYPRTPIVIDHLASVGEGREIREEDIRALCALARYPEVKVKLSAFYALGKGEPPHLDLAPLIKRVYEAFGPHRLMWGSDCPFQTDKESYEDSISLIRDRLDFITPEGKKWILRGTAEKFFFA
jgi:predicted TIM-barrel fold metal-dependent hydrolase